MNKICPKCGGTRFYANQVQRCDVIVDGKNNWVEQLPTTESKQELQKYMLNAYRVLLTRARSGMVICIPKGNGNKTPSGLWEDSTRLPKYYDGTYEYLKNIGIEEL